MRAGSNVPHHGSSGRHAPRDYARTPINVYWENHKGMCIGMPPLPRRSGAGAAPHAVTFDEGVAFLRQIREFGDPVPQLILTGGDPLTRPDLFDLIDEARKLGIGVSITPVATPALTRDVLIGLKEHSVEGLGLSLDGSTAARHHSIRGIPGIFDRTIQAMRWAQELEMPLQVNTLVAAETADDLPAIYELLKSLGVAQWSLFFLISVGRGKVLEPLSPEEGEKLMSWIYETSRIAPFVVATTEAPSYRRVALERMRLEGLTGEQIKGSSAYRGFGIRDGNGIVSK
jgi:MoaA/NifB/PqqE/SkfB family radical SAM enzyme